MKKIKLHLFALCATLVLVSCGGSNDDPVFNNTSAVYKVVLEASGDDYTAEAIIINPDNVSIIDETSNTDLKQSSVTEYFSGRKVYITSKEVKVISAQGIILSKSKSGAILKMTVYHPRYLQPIITQYFIDNKSEIWLLFLIAHSKR